MAQYADDLTIYLKRTESHLQTCKNIDSALDTIDEFRLLSGIKFNRGKTMLTIFGCKDTNTKLWDELKIKIQSVRDLV